MPLSEFGIAALDYAQRGLHPIPIRPRDKRALVPWEPYQQTPPTPEQITQWWTDTPTANVALVVGRGLVVVDLDGPFAEELLWDRNIVLPADAPRVQTGKGAHVYLRAPRTVRNRAALVRDPDSGSAVDVRGDGGYVLAPPSIHPNGSRYRWTQALDAGLPTVTPALLHFLGGEAAPTTPVSAPHLPPRAPGDSWVAGALRGVAAGQRNATCARLAGLYITRGFSVDETIAMLDAWGARCQPPLPPSEIRTVVASIARTDTRTHEATCPPPEPVGMEVMFAGLRRQIASPPMRIPTPWPGLNRRMLGGLCAGELIIAAGAPGVGKTSIATQIALHAATHGHPVTIYSLEMTAIELGQRMVAQHGGHSLRQLRTGALDWFTLERDAVAMQQLPIVMIERVNMEQIERHWDRFGTPQLLIIDHLQITPASHRVSRDRWLEVLAVCERLRALAKQHTLPIFVLSAMSGGETPELRGGNMLRYTADVLWCLTRPPLPESAAAATTDPTVIRTRLDILKNRNAAIGFVKFLYHGDTARFLEVEDDVGDARDATGTDPRYDAPPSSPERAAEGLARLVIECPSIEWALWDDADVRLNIVALSELADAAHCCPLCVRPFTDGTTRRLTWTPECPTRANGHA